MNTFIKTLEVKSDILIIKEKTKKILNQINELIEDEEELMYIRLILSELLINGAIHGNKGDKSKKVYLTLIISEEKIYISVRDEGEGIVYNKEDSKKDILKSSGRGLLIVSSLSDKLSIENSEVKVHKKLKKRA